MSDFTFSTINDKEFESLVLDILNAEFKLDLQEFKVGKDGGVDLRFSSKKNKNSIVVQAKHYLKSGYSQLKSVLKNDELPKVRKLNPDRYIIATSLELSVKEKDELVAVFHPYVLTANDIFSNQDLNKFLRKHKEIVKTHFKLWFSNTEIISNILNNAIEGRTKSYLERIKSKISLYVLTKNFDSANKILEQEKVLLITGEPGVGKTTLAEVLLFEKAKDKFKIYLINTIREAENIISIDAKEKQIFYFDDFLGEVYYEILTGSQKESEISRFVDRIKHTPNKFIILSTRTVIFEQARVKSEKIKRSRIDSGKYEVILDRYTKLEKAKILYNHLYFQNIPEILLNAIIKNKFYNEVINHKSYTPRIIEFITDSKRIEKFNTVKYLEFIIKNLDYPEEIWNDSFQNQIEYFDRNLLFTLFTFQRGITENFLTKAFSERLKYEKAENNKQIDNEQFNNSIKNLLNGFIVSSIIDVDNKIKKINFINPSVSDFILGYLNKNYGAKKAIISSIYYIEQFDIFNPEKNQFKIEIELQNLIKNNIDSENYDSIDKYKEFRIVGYYINILMKYCRDIDIDVILLKQLKNINFNYIWWIKADIEHVFEKLENCPLSLKYLKDNFHSIITKYIDELEESEKALKLPLIFEKFDYKFQEYTNDEIGQEKLVNLISRVVTTQEKNLMSSFKDSIESWEEYDNLIYDEINELKGNLLNELCPDVSFDIPKHFKDEVLEEQLKNNEINFQESIKREKKRDRYYEEMQYKSDIELKKIDDLFYKEQ